MELFPTMSKAFALVLQIEQQKGYNLPVEMNALSLEQKIINLPKKPFDKKKAQAEKKEYGVWSMWKKWARQRHIFQGPWYPWLIPGNDRKEATYENQLLLINELKKKTVDGKLTDIIRAEVKKMINSAQDILKSYCNAFFKLCW